MTTFGTERPTYLQHSIPPPARSLGSATRGIERWSSKSSSLRLLLSRTTLDIHIVLDNLATHKTPAIKRWLAKRPRFHFHFTPTHASWLNLVERFFGLLTEHALRRGSHTSVHQLKTAIHDYLDAHNDEPKPFKWTKSADQILGSLASPNVRSGTWRTRLCIVIKDPGD